MQQQSSEAKLSQVLKNLRKKAIKMVISKEEYQRRRKKYQLGEFLYCTKIKNSPFGNHKGLLGEEKLRRDMVYVFAKGYAFYLSKEFGLVKILNFYNHLKYGYKKYHKSSTKINFDETNLVLVQEISDRSTYDKSSKTPN